MYLWMDVVVVSLILFAAIFLFSGFALAKEKEVSTQIEEKSSLIWDSDSMLVFLRQPKQFDFNSDGMAENGTIADLVTYSYEKKNTDELNKELHAFFDQRFTSIKEGWSLIIYSLREKKAFVYIVQRDFGPCLSSRKPIADIMLPTKSQNSPLRITLFWDRSKGVCLP